MSNRTRQPRRLGTKLALCGVALALITYNLRGKAVGSPKVHVWRKSTESGSLRDAAAWSRWEHGWPLSYLRQARYRWYNEFKPGQIPRAQILAEAPRWLLPPFDSIVEGVGPLPKFSLIFFSLNLAVAFVILASTARMTDKWLRTHVKPLKIRIKRPVWPRRFQYGLRTLLCLPVLLGITLCPTDIAR